MIRRGRMWRSIVILNGAVAGVQVLLLFAIVMGAVSGRIVSVVPVRIGLRVMNRVYMLTGLSISGILGIIGMQRVLGVSRIQAPWMALNMLWKRRKRLVKDMSRARPWGLRPLKIRITNVVDRRSSALFARLTRVGMSRRLRLSRMPCGYHPWLGGCLG